MSNQEDIKLSGERIILIVVSFDDFAFWHIPYIP